MNACTRDEWMTVAAARLLKDQTVCFVGIGLPSAACNLARLTHAPGIVLIYESGAIGTRPDVLPLSIGDGELAETATCVVPLPEIFSFYLQAGRVDVGFLGAAQIDRYGNLNSTVIGAYERPRVRLPGAGGAPEIALLAKQVFVMLRATPRSCVTKLDFCTSAGYLSGDGARARVGAPGAGPRAVITDFGMLAPHPDSEELQLVALFDGVDIDEACAAVGWPLRKATTIETITAPTPHELETLRSLTTRSRDAHADPVRVPSLTQKASP
ncbi:MAG: CoA-transferase subunit beta [Rhodanobacteraceae bacterium]